MILANRLVGSTDLLLEPTFGYDFFSQEINVVEYNFVSIKI